MNSLFPKYLSFLEPLQLGFGSKKSAPAAPAPVPPPAPPSPAKVTTDARTLVAKNAANRKGFGSTILSKLSTSDYGGTAPSPANNTGRTILGQGLY